MRGSKIWLSRNTLGGALLMAACSLTVPDEEEFFGPGGPAAGSAGMGGAPGGNTGAGGSAVSGGGSSGTPSGGAAGTTAEAGQSGDAGAGGGAGFAGAGGESGSGGTPAGGQAGESGSGGAGGEGGVDPGLAPFDPKQGLVVHYAFEETAGTSVRDSTTNANDGVISGTATWVTTGKVGRALQLSGQQSFVSIPPGFFSSLEEVTLSIWFNQDSRVLWTRVLDFGSSPMHWMYFAPATVQVNEQGARAALDVANFITAELHMPTVLPAAMEWMHVTLTWQKSSFACYINGVLVAEETTPMYTPAEFVTLTPGGEAWRAWIGRSSFAADAYFMGRVDEFRAYDHVLPPEHVAELHALED